MSYWTIFLWLAMLPGQPGPATFARPDQQQPSVCPTVTGRILDQNQQPLVGATVQVQGTLTVHTTNSEGFYVLRGPVAQGTRLTVGAAGYSALEFQLATCQQPDISLTLLPGTKLKNNGRIKRTTATGKVKP